MKLTTLEGAFRRLAARMSDVQRADLVFALVTLWLGRLCSGMDYTAGSIFMRRMGSATLTSTGSVLNVLPFGVRLDVAESSPVLAQ